MDDRKTPPAFYDVGNRKPPLATRWKPGQSGNPKGKRPGTKSLKAMFLEAALAKPRLRYEKDDARHYATQIEAMLGHMFDSAAHGGEKAQKKILALWPLLMDDEESGSSDTEAAPDAAEAGETTPCNAREIG